MAHQAEDRKTYGSKPPWVVAVVVGVTLSIGLSMTPALAARATGPANLPAAVALGVVDPSVLEALRDRGFVEALVSVDGDQALLDARPRSASARSPPMRT